MLNDPFGTHSASPRHAVASSMLRGAHLQHRGTPACPRAAATSRKVVVFHVLTHRSSHPAFSITQWGSTAPQLLSQHEQMRTALTTLPSTHRGVAWSAAGPWPQVRDGVADLS